MYGASFKLKKESCSLDLTILELGLPSVAENWMLFENQLFPDSQSWDIK
jgi:hypothetical protein